jgi:hypothetical protein
MPRYADWMRRVGTEGADPFVIDEAKRLLGFVALRAKSLGLNQYRLQRELADGTIISASVIGGIPTIEIKPVPITQVTEIRLNNKLWIPRGFVVYPSTTSHFKGWGMPVVPLGANPWDALNLDPGVDTDRWTSGGLLGEVFISKDKEAGYQSKTTPSAPMFFDEEDATRTLAGTYRAPRTGVWAGYRPEFLDYRGSPAFSRAFFEYTLTQRATPLTPPFRGYFEDGLYLAQHAVATVMDGADPELTPTTHGYQFAVPRQNKDGKLDDTSADAVGSYPTDVPSAAGQIDAYINLFDAAFKENTQLDVAIQGNVVGASLMVRDQWIRYGNHYWTPTDTTLPILSWDGDDGFVLPYATITSSFYTDGFGHMQPNNVTMVGPYPDYEIQELSNFTADIRARTAAKIYTKNLYARGRVLGDLPGYVFGAAIKTTEHFDRIMVLTWHAEDQDVYIPPSPSFINPPEPHIFGKLRLYFSDVVPRHGLRCVPDHMLTGADWRLAGTLPTTDFSVAQLYPTVFGRQAPRFSPDASKLALVQGTYLGPLDGGVDRWNHRLCEFVLSTIEEGTLTYATNLILPNGVGFDEESFEAVDYDASNVRQALVTRLWAWPQDDFFPEFAGDTVDMRTIAREDGSSRQPYQTPDSPLSPQCRPQYFGSFRILDVVDYVMVDVYLTGVCSTASAYASRLIVIRNGVRIHDAEYPQNSTNRVYGGSGQGRWYGANYAKNQAGDWIITAEHGAWDGATLVRNNALVVIIATADSRVLGYVGSSIPDISELVGVSDASLSLVPAGVV